MRRVNFKSCLWAGSFCFTFLLSGCISVPSSPTPRFYALSTVNEDRVGKKIKIASGTIVGIGPVKIPEYLNRPQIVTKNKEEMLQFAQFDRWGESLDIGMARLIREGLTTMLPGTKLTLYPWNPSIAVKYQVAVEVVQLDSDINKDMFLAVQWTVIDVQNSKALLIKRSEFRQPITPHNYSGLVKALSTVCTSLSGQIAETIGLL